MKKLLVLAFSLFSVLSFAETNSNWFYPATETTLGGYFHRTTNSDASGHPIWIETINGKIAYEFIQLGTSNEPVILVDNTRGIAVMLYADRMEIKTPADTQFNYFRAGGWDNRRILITKHPDNTVTYFLLQPGNIWKLISSHDKEVHQDGRLYKEMERNSTRIVLFNAQRNEFMYLYATTADRQIAGDPTVHAYIWNAEWNK